jgi:hypothetical protein
MKKKLGGINNVVALSSIGVNLMEDAGQRAGAARF